MSVKICFYTSIVDNESLKQNKNILEENAMRKIEAGEVCSEFIARYFQKVKNIPQNLLDKIIEENYQNYSYEKAVKDMYRGMYKVNIEKMNQDKDSNFEFRIFNECKNVREELLNKYNKLNNKIQQKGEVEIYAILSI